MKVELQCGDTITIPEGCKATIKDGSVVFEKEEQNEQEFKDGDVVVPVLDGHRLYAFIYKSTDTEGFHSFYVGLDTCSKLIISDSPDVRWCDNDLSHATKEEKDVLFYSMKEKGLQWNAEEKRVEKIRWRAKGKEIYYYVGNNMEVYTFSPSTSEDEEDDFKSYNYFRIKEQAKEAAKRIREALRQYHEEIGE